MAMTDLSLPQALLLLSLDDTTGAKRHGSTLGYGVAGATLAELALSGRIRLRVQTDRLGPFTSNRSWVDVVDASPTDLPSCDAMLAEMASGKTRSPKAWVEKMHRRLVGTVTDELVDRGVLRRETTTVLGAFPMTRYPQLDPRPEAELRAALEAVVRGELPPTDRLAALAALAEATGSLKGVVPGLRGRARKARIQQLGEGEWGSEAAREAIQAAAAAAAAVIAVASAGGDGSS